jgi:hypothetical protein
MVRAALVDYGTRCSEARDVDDYEIFDADGALTAEFLLARGYCCANGCRNCPYEPRHGGLEAVPRAKDEGKEVSVSHLADGNPS